MKKLIILTLALTTLLIISACSKNKGTSPDSDSHISTQGSMDNSMQSASNDSAYTFTMAKYTERSIIFRLEAHNLVGADASNGWVVDFGGFEVAVRPMVIGESTLLNEMRGYFVCHSNWEIQADAKVTYDGKAFVVTVDFPLECDCSWDAITNITVSKIMPTYDGYKVVSPVSFNAYDVTATVGDINTALSDGVFDIAWVNESNISFTAETSPEKLIITLHFDQLAKEYTFDGDYFDWQISVLNSDTNEMYWIGKCEIKAPDKFRFDRMEFYPSYPSDFDVEYDYENKTITFTDALKNPFDSDSWGPLKLMINVTAGNGGDSVTIYE